MAPALGRTDLFRALAAGVVAAPAAVAAAVPVSWATGLRVDEGTAFPVLVAMVFWPLYTACYLAWTLRTYSVLTAPGLRALARHEDRGSRSLVQRLTGASGFVNTLGGAASTAVVVLFVIAGRADLRGEPLVLLLGLVNVAASWVLMVHLFAQSYLRLDAGAAPGTHLALAVDGPARFQDYLDVALLVSTMGAAVPVEPRSRVAWQLLRTNTLVAFTFNSLLIAMLASLLLGTSAG